MNKESILYGTIGLLVGIIIGGFSASYAVNNNNTGMMRMMGMNSQHDMVGNIDKRFIEEMIPHHESAIAMAKIAQQKSTKPEIKTLANNIIASQSTEISTMSRWYKDWYGAGVPKQSGQTMMGGSMMSSQTDMDNLSSATDFDKSFLEQMIPHHQMAVVMANMLEQGTNRSEMKKLADDITAAQTKEIQQMKQWQKDWGYASNSSNSNGMMDMRH